MATRITWRPPSSRPASAELLALTAEHRVAVMCAESVWWRCHRRLLADHLVLVDGAAVEHVFHDHRVTAHPVTPGARVLDRTVVYDAGAPVHLPFAPAAMTETCAL